MRRDYEDSGSILPKVIVRRRSRERRLIGAVRGVLSGIGPQGEPLVDFCANASGHPVVAVTTVLARQEDVGKEAILFFEDGDPARPLLVGLVLSTDSAQPQPAAGLDVKVDGRTVSIKAEDE